MKDRLFRYAPQAAILPLLMAIGCGPNFVRRPEEPRHEYPAGLARILWRTSLNEYPTTVAAPEECASGVVVGSSLVMGSRAGKAVALDVDSGALVWSQNLRGAVDGDARYDEVRRQVYVGTDDGYLYALNPETGAIRWSFQGKGSVLKGPSSGAQGLYFATTADRLYALDPKTGAPRWQYDREAPEGFSIHGYAAPTLANSHVFAGFSDGYLVALQADTGTLLWSRSLASASEQYVDVDTQPLVKDGKVFAASFSGGLYAVREKDGELLWRSPLEGTSGITLGKDFLYAAAPRTGMAALNWDGNLRWRQGIAAAGDITAPAELGAYLVWSTSRDGLFIADRITGKLLQTFDPARGMCAAPTVDVARRRIYVLANNGMLYSLAVGK